MRSHLREVDAAYIAGILDGEGYITINKQVNVHCVGQDKPYTYIPRIDVTQARRELLDHIANLIQYGYNIRKGGKYGSFFRISLNSDAIQWLLPQIIPHLILKKQQAMLVLEYSLHRAQHRYGRKGRSQDVYNYQTSLYQRVKDLNSLDYYRSQLIGADSEVIH